MVHSLFTTTARWRTAHLAVDDEIRRLTVRAEHWKQGASFDRFGLFNIQAGGHFENV